MSTQMNTLTDLRLNNEVTPTMPLLTRGFYQKTFLAIAEAELVHERFGMANTIPQHTGEQIMWRRWHKLAPNTVPLTEGITPAGKKLGYTNVIGLVKWYGDWVGITDRVKFVAPDNILTIATSRLALQAAQTADIITRDIINAGTGFLRVTADGAAVSDQTTGVGARVTVQGCITKKVLDTTITELEAADAKYIQPKMNATTKIDTQPIGPSYVAIIHPHVSHDFVNALAGFGVKDWVARENYAGGTVAYPTEVGKYRNVRFVTSTLAKIWPDTGGTTTVGTDASSVYRSTTGTNGDVYSVLVLAKEAFGKVNLAGTSMTYYNPSGGNSDPLHQRCTAGWKFCKTATILNDTFMKRIECLATW